MNSAQVLCAECSDDCVGVAFDVARFMTPTLHMANFGWLVALLPVLGVAYRCAGYGLWNRHHLKRMAFVIGAVFSLAFLCVFTFVRVVGTTRSRSTT